jgi:hypothetical protein
VNVPLKIKFISAGKERLSDWRRRAGDREKRHGQGDMGKLSNFKAFFHYI